MWRSASQQEKAFDDDGTRWRTQQEKTFEDDGSRSRTQEPLGWWPRKRCGTTMQGLESRFVGANCWVFGCNSAEFFQTDQQNMQRQKSMTFPNNARYFRFRQVRLPQQRRIPRIVYDKEDKESQGLSVWSIDSTLWYYLLLQNWKREKETPRI